MQTREELVEEVIERELEMFLAVKAKTPVSCQENPDGFKLFRSAHFSVWSDNALQSYLEDLQQAKEKNINLCTLKYARMEKIIPPIKENDIIEKIVDIQIAWTQEIAKKYPVFYNNARPVEHSDTESTSTKDYLKGELETYSNKTLDILYKDILLWQDRNKNQVEEIYIYTVYAMGFSSLEEIENIFKKRIEDRLQTL